MAARDVHVLRESAGEGTGRRAGAQLQRARERRGMSATDVAAALHLDLRTVSALERDAWDELPPTTFARGYYRAYARFMELPEESVLEALDGDGLGGERRPLQARVGALAGSRRGSWFPGAMLVLLAAGVIGSTLWYRQQLESHEVDGGPAAAQPSADGAADLPAADPSSGVSAGESEPPTAASPETPAMPSPQPPLAVAPTSGGSPPSAGVAAPSGPTQSPQPAAADAGPRIPEASAEAAPSAAAPAPDAGDRLTAAPGPASSAPGGDPAPAAPLDGESAAPGPAVASETTPAASAQGQEAAQSPPPAAEAVRSPPLATQSLELRLAGPSWVEVVDARGERLIYGLLSDGSRRTVSGVPPISVVIGDAAVAELRYRGDLLPLQDHTQGKVARLTLGQERTQ